MKPLSGARQVAFQRSLEMSIGRDDFLRLLRQVGPFEVGGQAIRGRDGDRHWVMRLVPLSDRRLGSVAVARLRVEIALEGSSDAEGEAFMERFRRAFLRGGG
jgi:hypothetical protein